MWLPCIAGATTAAQIFSLFGPVLDEKRPRCCGAVLLRASGEQHTHCPLTASISATGFKSHIVFVIVSSSSSSRVFYFAILGTKTANYI